LLNPINVLVLALLLSLKAVRALAIQNFHSSLRI